MTALAYVLLIDTLAKLRALLWKVVENICEPRWHKRNHQAAHKYSLSLMRQINCL